MSKMYEVDLNRIASALEDIVELLKPRYIVTSADPEKLEEFKKAIRDLNTSEDEFQGLKGSTNK